MSASKSDKLSTYRSKRAAGTTPEPFGGTRGGEVLEVAAAVVFAKDVDQSWRSLETFPESERTVEQAAGHQITEQHTCGPYENRRWNQQSAEDEG